ncbi:MAG: hypothetical protein IT360_03740 [Gemmatimonadaceae bacterium]|nr:hypothetical protein [Gemmatimonadaceae bacterium]
MPRHRIASLALLAALATLACGERAPGTSSADSATADRVAPQSTSPVAWTVTESGIGPLRAGMDLASAVAAVPGTLSAAAGVPDMECQYATWSDAPQGVRVMIVAGVVERVEIHDPSIATAAGARVGDAVERIETLYAGRVRRTPHKYTDGSYLTVVAVPPADTLHRLVFETDGTRVTTYRAGRIPAVEYVEGCA